MTTVRLTAEITESGELIVDLPSGLPPGKVEIAIEIPEPTWTDEEIAQALQFKPMTGAEIVAAGLTGGWKDENITDGATWVQEHRRKRREQRGW